MYVLLYINVHTTSPLVIVTANHILAPPGFPHPAALGIRIVRTQETMEVYESSVYHYVEIQVGLTPKCNRSGMARSSLSDQNGQERKITVIEGLRSGCLCGSLIHCSE